MKGNGPQPGSGGTVKPLLAAEVSEVQKRIGDGEFKQAERKLISLSEGRRGDSQIENLWDVLRRARTGVSGELPIHDSGNLPSQWWQSRQNKMLAIGIGAAFLLLLMIVWFLARGFGAQTITSPPPGSGPAQDAVAPAEPETALPGDQAVSPSDTGPASESLILVPANGAQQGQESAADQPSSDIPLEEWSGDSSGKAKEIPLEEFSGDGSIR